MENYMTQTTTTRRGFLKGATATAATLLAAKALFPSGAFAQGAGPEVAGAKLGFIALTDAAPLIIRARKGSLRQTRRAGC
jgi:nitrate/nitrite transport system substrate-binding protein